MSVPRRSNSRSAPRSHPTATAGGSGDAAAFVESLRAEVDDLLSSFAERREKQAPRDAASRQAAVTEAKERVDEIRADIDRFLDRALRAHARTASESAGVRRRFIEGIRARVGTIRTEVERAHATMRDERSRDAAAEAKARAQYAAAIADWSDRFTREVARFERALHTTRMASRHESERDRAEFAANLREDVGAMLAGFRGQRPEAAARRTTRETPRRVRAARSAGPSFTMPELRAAIANAGVRSEPARPQQAVFPRSEDFQRGPEPAAEAARPATRAKGRRRAG